MNKKLVFALFLSVSFCAVPTAFAQKKASLAAPHATPLASPASTPVPSPSPSATPLAPAALKQLGREFARAQSNELKAADHQNRSAIKELRASQNAHQKEWERKEKEARHKFFADHPSGPERRAYIGDFLTRRKIFVQMLSDESNQRAHEQDVRLKSLRDDQASRLKEFQDFAQKGERPPERLWPVGH